MDERQVEKILEGFTDQLEQAIETIEGLTAAIAEMEELVEVLGKQEDLKKNFGVKFESRQTERKVRDLQSKLQKLDRELSDTSRKVSDIRW